MKEILRLEKICKKSEYHELYNINLNLFEGEILTVMLRNKMVKNTLIDILSGQDSPDSGSIYIQDHKVDILSTTMAKQIGIFCVFQHSQLITNLNISDNIFINRDYILLQSDFASKETNSLLRRYGITHVDSHTLARELSFALSQIIEIIKVVTLGAKVLIIDNITTCYNVFELSRLITLLKKLAGEGLSIIVFTNAYSDLINTTDRVTIIRNGTTCFHLDNTHISKDRVLSILAGFPITDYQCIKSFKDGTTTTADADLHDCCLSLRDLSNNEGLNNINLDLMHGEILGILDTYRDYALQLVDILTTGTAYSGTICMNGSDISIASYKDAVRKGIGLINCNSDSPGIFFNLSLIDNITMMMPKVYTIFERQRLKKFLLWKSLEAIHCQALIDTYGIEKLLPPLSKSTQMKVLIAKWICAGVKILILVNPHSYFDDIDLDILKQLLKDTVSQGISVLIVSSSMQPLLALCDRISILDDGTISEILEV